MTATQERYRSLRLAYAMVGAPSVWIIQFLIAYGLIDLGCGLGLDARLITALVLIVTILTLLAALAAGWIAIGLWREARRVANGQSAFIAALGIASSMIFSLTLVLTAITATFVSTCGEIAA